MTEHKRISELDEANDLTGLSLVGLHDDGEEAVRVPVERIVEETLASIVMPQPEPPASSTAPLVAVAVGAILGAQVLHFLLGLVGIAL